ncbi:hypothetical protein N9H28_03395, partial [Flavobacteriaceae bacterium]|nr:hypothetical protein [Flavobacteriaceae bacterium]MDB9948236.1 hypothetical protein [Flavobacteriaceae bacterium]
MKIKQTKIIFNKIIFSLLFTISIQNATSAQTGDLYYQIKKSDFNIEKTRSSLDYLGRSVNGKNSVKKEKAKRLQANVKIISQKSYVAYKRAKQIVKKLEEAKNYKLAEKVGGLRSDLYNLNYAANALEKYCQWMINKPRSHGAKSFKSMIRAFNTIIENYNKA